MTGIYGINYSNNYSLTGNYGYGYSTSAVSSARVSRLRSRPMAWSPTS